MTSSRLSKGLFQRATLVLGALISLVSLAAADFSSLAPEETLLYAQIRDVSQLRAAWEKTPYFKMWSDPRFTLFFKPLAMQVKAGKAKAEKESGLTFEELKRIFPGEAAFFLSDLRATFNQSTQRLYRETNSGLIGRIAPGSEEKVRKMIEEQTLGDLPADAARSSESFMGVKIFVTIYKKSVAAQIPDRTERKSKKVQPSENALSLPTANDDASLEYHYEYAFVDNTVILLEGQRAFMKKIIANYFAAKTSGAAPGSLAATPGFKSAFQSGPGKTDILAYANIERLVKQAADDPSYAFVRAEKGLRLGEIKGVGLAIDLSPEATEIDFVVRTSPSPTGVARLMVNGRTNDFQSLKLTPRNAISYSSSLIEFSDVYQLVGDTAAQLWKDGRERFDAAVAQISQNAKVDVSAMLSQMGGEVAVFAYPADGSNSRKISQVFLVHLKNPEGFAENMSKLLPIFGGRPRPGTGAPPALPGVAKAEFKGFTIHTIGGAAPAEGQSIPMGGSRYSFAIAKSSLIISGDSEAVKEVLRHIVGDARDDLTGNETYRKAVGELKPGYKSVSWADMGRWVEDSARTLQEQPMMMAIVGRYVQINQMPSPEAFSRFFGQMVSGGYSSSDGYHCRVRITAPK